MGNFLVRRRVFQGKLGDVMKKDPEGENFLQLFCDLELGGNFSDEPRRGLSQPFRLVPGSFVQGGKVP
jgi:hypothetical protein